MKTMLINGTLRKSTTYQIAKQFINNLSSGENVDEFFMPEDCPNFCRSCFQCFTDNTKCPDYNYIKPKILKQSHNLKPCIKVKGIFYLMRFVHKKFGFNPPDIEHWKANGWLDKKRPWKQAK